MRLFDVLGTARHVLNFRPWSCWLLQKGSHEFDVSFLGGVPRRCAGRLDGAGDKASGPRGPWPGAATARLGALTGTRGAKRCAARSGGAGDQVACCRP